MERHIDCEKFALAAVSSITGDATPEKRAEHAIEVYTAAFEAAEKFNENLEEEPTKTDFNPDDVKGLYRAPKTP